MIRKRETVLVEASSGNVYDDLGLGNSGELLAKAQLVSRIGIILEQRSLTQVQAAKLLGIDQPKISALLRGKFDGYTTDRLFRFLNALGQDVEIVLRATNKGHAKASTRVISA